MLTVTNQCENLNIAEKLEEGFQQEELSFARGALFGMLFAIPVWAILITAAVLIFN